MGHIAIFLYMISFIIGIASIRNCKRIVKDQALVVLMPFLKFLVLFNLNLLLNFTALYLSINLAEQINPGNLITVWIVIGWLSFFTIFGSTWYFLQVLLNLLPIKGSRFFALTLKSLGFGFIIVFSVGMAFYVIQKTSIVYAYAIPVSGCAFLSFGILLSILLAIEANNVTVPKKKLVLRISGCLFFALFSMMATVSIVHLKTSVLLLSVISLSLNLFILYGFKPFIKRVIGNYPFPINNSISIVHILERHNISEREKQVLELIIKGKSNKEIEQELLISSHTVKNHIYSIFRKIGVQSRGQLINKILRVY